MSKFTTYFKNVKAKYKIKNHLTYYIMIAFTVLFTILSLTGGIKRSSAFLLEQIGYSIILAVSLSLVFFFLQAERLAATLRQVIIVRMIKIAFFIVFFLSFFIVFGI